MEENRIVDQEPRRGARGQETEGPRIPKSEGLVAEGQKNLKPKLCEWKILIQAKFDSGGKKCFNYETQV